MNTSNERPPEDPGALTNDIIRVPRAAHARLLLHGLEADSPFIDALREALPDEDARLAYLNHLAWQVRS